MASIRVFVKKQIEVGRMNFGQKQMLKLGTVGLADVKRRISRAQNDQDAPSKPLTRRYAIRKSKLRRVGFRGTNKRDLTFTGDLMRSWQVRTVSEAKAAATWSTLRNRQKARSNQRIEDFISFSPSNVRAVSTAAGQVVAELIPRLVKTKNG